MECPCPAEISEWIPVIGTLSGVVIGICGGLINSRFSQKIKEDTERENRERERIEDLYEILIVIRMYYQGELFRIIQKVCIGKEVVSKVSAVENTSIPPLIKLDMVIHMYFQNLTEAHKKFLAVKDRFGKKLVDNVRTSYINESLETKQRIIEEFRGLFTELDGEILNLQQTLASLVKA